MQLPDVPPASAQSAAAPAWQTALKPLCDAMVREQLAVLWVGRHSVHAAAAAGDVATALQVSPADFALCWAALVQPWRPNPQLCVRRLGDQIVLERAPDGTIRPDTLAREGWVSPLVARTLVAALGLGRNIVWTGPHGACCQLMASLAQSGRHPGLWADMSSAPVPAGWWAVDSAAMALAAGVDRLVAWPAEPDALPALLVAGSGVQAWLQAGRLDRALMRLELAATRAARGDASLQMLAGIDLVVVVGDGPAPHVVQVAELTLDDAGYRPALLFATGDPMAPHALTPRLRPSFYSDLVAAGDGLLAADLAHATPAAGVPVSPAAADPAAEASTHGGPGAGPSSGPPPRAPARPPRARAPTAAADLASHPGWELDRLLGATAEADATATAATTPATDLAGLVQQTAAAAPVGAGLADATAAAALAAQFGLGPPPRPTGPPRSMPPVATPTDDEGQGNP